MQYFRDLGERIDREWRAREYAEGALPPIAQAALADRPPHRHVSAADIAGWLIAAESLPRQLDRALRFGDPPVTVFSTPQFYIDVYFWRSASPLIHDHPFSGAFCVIDGCSVHAVYSFEERERISQRVRLGAIELRECELIRAGDSRVFRPETPLIHRLLHADVPSVSLVVRTAHTVRPTYFAFEPPALAVDMTPEPAFELSVRKRAMLRHLRHGNDPAYAPLLEEFVARADFEELYRLVHELYVECDELAELDPVIARARRAHGARADILRPVFDDKLRVAQIESLRGELSAEASRFALSLLLVAPPRSRILELLRERYPEREPTAVLADAVRELARVEDGVALAPEFSDLELTEPAADAFASLVTGAAAPADADRARLRSVFARSPITAPLFREERR